jgi:hypothetical protein
MSTMQGRAVVFERVRRQDLVGGVFGMGGLGCDVGQGVGSVEITSTRDDPGRSRDEA